MSAEYGYTLGGVISWAEGLRQKLNSLERPQLLFAPDGRPSVLLAAVDESPERSRSYNVRIPLGKADPSR